MSAKVLSFQEFKDRELAQASRKAHAELAALMQQIFGKNMISEETLRAAADAGHEANLTVCAIKDRE
jgi:hypothetical protein